MPLSSRPAGAARRQVGIMPQATLQTGVLYVRASKEGRITENMWTMAECLLFKQLSNCPDSFDECE